MLAAVAMVFFWHACWSSLRLHIPALVVGAPAPGNVGPLGKAIPGSKAPATVQCERRTRFEQRQKEQATAVAIGYARMAFLGLKAIQNIAAQPAVSQKFNSEIHISITTHISFNFGFPIISCLLDFH